MPSPPERLHARCQLMQLLAQAFSHPDEKFCQRLRSCQFHTAVNKAMEVLSGRATALTQMQLDFTTYETQYIELFQVGKGGKPAVDLHAGDYEQLLDGQPRPEFMLDHSRWYKHFGLKTRQDDEQNEQPDHIVCQLEFMSWLAHLEASIEVGSSLARGYQAAQRDFIERQLKPLLELIVQGLQRETMTRHSTPFFMELGTLTMDVAVSAFHELNSILGSVDTVKEQGDSSSATVEEAVNLWA